jgi:hypothetical protein
LRDDDLADAARPLPPGDLDRWQGDVASLEAPVADHQSPPRLGDRIPNLQR